MSAESFTNEPIAIDTLPKFEEVILKKPHADYLKIIWINLFIWIIFTGLPLILSLLFIDEVKPYFTSISIAYLIIVIIVCCLYHIGFNKRGYAVRTKDLIYKSGVIAESTTIIPLNRIQHIELNEGIFSRMFKLATLQIFTAGGQSGHLKVSGIPIDEAKSIRDLILQKLDLIGNPSTNIEALHE